MSVVRLGAWCGHPRLRPDMTLSFAVHEFAVLDDGRRVTLHEERGLSMSVSDRSDPWLTLSAEDLEHDVRNVVLPDDDDTLDEHPYDWLAGKAREQGVETTADHLRTVPYDVVLSDEVRERLRR